MVRILSWFTLVAVTLIMTIPSFCETCENMDIFYEDFLKLPRSLLMRIDVVCENTDDNCEGFKSSQKF
ncbi:MAG: hypothetical protein F6K63_04255 [Moorea sp. SIO1G6]|nr:hypothetical protein [Moorena sp. SIO1G6]